MVTPTRPPTGGEKPDWKAVANDYECEIQDQDPALGLTSTVMKLVRAIRDGDRKLGMTYAGFYVERLSAMGEHRHAEYVAKVLDGDDGLVLHAASEATPVERESGPEDEVRDAARALVTALDRFEPTLASMTARCYGDSGYPGPYFKVELAALRSLTGEGTEDPSIIRTELTAEQMSGKTVWFRPSEGE